MSATVFNRVESKFLITKEIYLKILPHITEVLSESVTYKIKNIYYDTEQNDLIKKSLSKPFYKEKLRLRMYQTNDQAPIYFMEIKKKIGDQVNKRRSEIRFSEVAPLLRFGHLDRLRPYHNAQVIKEIEFMLSRYTLNPAMYIAYDRVAYEKDGFRVTFDQNIVMSATDFDFDCNNITTNNYNKEKEPLLDPDTILMEVKANQALPMWFVKLLSYYQLYPIGFSKYGKAFEITYKGAMSKCLKPLLKIS